MSGRSEIKQQTLTGLGWAAVSRLFQQVAQVGFTAILSRILVPHDFGLLVLMSVFTGFASVFVDFGFSSAIVQRPDLGDRHRDAAFWLNFAFGTLLTLVTMGLAPAIALFYDEPRLLVLTLAFAPNFLIGSLAGVPGAIAQREMAFRKIALIENVSFVGASAIAVAMALTGFGVWSLIELSLAGTAIRTLLFWVSTPWRPKFRLDRTAVRDLWGFSSQLTGFNAVNYWARNADNLLIGRFVGTNPLAFYNRAYNLMLMPLDSVSTVTTRVMYPMLSRLQHDRDQVKTIYLRSLRLISIVTFPAIVGLFVLCRPIILTIYGPKWAPVVPLLQVLCFASLVQTLVRTTGWIFQSQGETRQLFRLGIVTSVTVIASFFVGLPWGVRGVAIAYTVWSVLISYPTFAIAGKPIGLTAAEVCRSLARVLAVAVTMGVVVWLVNDRVSDLANWLRLAIGIPTGAVSYGLALRFLAPESYAELLHFGRSYARRRAGAADPASG